MADGPRALKPTEWDQLDHVVGTVFRPAMFQNYPQLFNESNIENLRVVADVGKLVCHVGMIERPASLAGCRIDVANIGGVATLNEYRGNGYASAAFQDACDKAARDGIDLMLISGGRGLYTRVGCRQVGLDWDFTLDAPQADRLSSVRPPGGGGFTFAPVTKTDIPQLRALYAAEHVRFIRRAEDWAMALDCRVVMNTPSDFWGVRVGAGEGGLQRAQHLGDTIVAYVVVHQPDKARRRPEDPLLTRVVEFAGQRAAVLASLPELRRHYDTESVRIHAQGSDPVLPDVLRLTTGAAPTPSGFSGTLRVINFVQLMERCRPLLAERLGHAATSSLTFHADSPPGSEHRSFTIRRGDEEVRIADLASLAIYLFGARGRIGDDSDPTGSPTLLSDLSRALPLPCLWYGISYV